MKKFFVMTAVILLTVASTCSALGRNEFSLGGVYLDMPYSEVVAMYGQPTQHPGGYAQLVSDVIIYGNDVEIGFLGNKVRYVVTTANNGWRTPSGLCVGMSINDAIRLYGSDYKTQTRTAADIPDWMKDSDKPYYAYKWHGTKYSWSRTADTYSYSSGDTAYVLSVVEDGGKIIAIELSQLTPEY